MEMGCIGFLLGALVAIVFVGIGVCFGRLDKGKLSGDSNSDVHNPSDDREYRSVDRHTTEEMIQVLEVLRLGACRHERQILNEIIEMLEEREEKEDD